MYRVIDLNHTCRCVTYSEWIATRFAELFGGSVDKIPI